MSKSPAAMIGRVVLDGFGVPSSIDLALQIELSILHHKAIPIVTIDANCKNRIGASFGCLQDIDSCMGSSKVPGCLCDVTVVGTISDTGPRSYFQTRIVFNDSYFIVGEFRAGC